MKVLITGGTGTISSGLVQECVDRGYEVVTLTRGSSKERNIPGAKYLYCDIRNPESVNKVLGSSKFDVVVECLVYEVWQLKISLSVFANRCDQYVFISTAAVYNRKGEIRIKESDEKNFTVWSYSRNKIACEKYLAEYFKDKTVKYTIVRPNVTYGNYRIPYPVATRTPGWTVFQRMIDGKPMLAGDNVKYAVLHIDDFSNMVVSLFGNELAYNEDFHICSNKNDIYWDDVIRLAEGILNVKALVIHVPVEDFKKVYPVVYDEMKYNKNTTVILDDAKIRNTTGVEAKINLEEGMSSIIASMKKEFDDLSLTVDASWNDYCNATIYYSYKHHHLSEIEQKALDEYFRSHGEQEFKKSEKTVRQKNLKRLIRRILHKGKSLVKRRK